MDKNKCKNCIYYIIEKSVNNCSQNVVGTVKPEDSSCYKIKYIDSNKL